MSKHYGDFSNAKDKIIHLLCRAYVEGLYGQAIVECVLHYGEEITNESVETFKADHKEYLERC